MYTIMANFEDPINFYSWNSNNPVYQVLATTNENNQQYEWRLNGTLILNPLAVGYYNVVMTYRTTIIGTSTYSVREHMDNSGLAVTTTLYWDSQAGDN